MRHFSPLLLSLAFLFLYGLTPAQNPDYKDMMYDIQYNVYDVIRAADAYFEEYGKGKGSGYKGYERWREVVEPMFYPTGDRSRFNPAQLYEEMEKVRRENTGRSTAAGPGEHWRFMGPDYANNLLSPSYAAGVGRIETVWADFASLDTILLGARNGGFWKSVDGGANWESTTQDLPAVGVVDVEVNPDNHAEVWIVTRHATGYSLGLMKSTDFGDTWNTTSLSFPVNSDRLYDLYINEANVDTMYLSAQSGFWRSVDGGANWNNVLSGRVRTFAVHPANSQEIYLVKNSDRNSVLTSHDGGLTFPDTTTIAANNNSTPTLATTPDRNSVVYFASSQGIWKSDDYGASFALQGNAPASRMTFGVSDTDHTLCVFGSLDQFISTTSGQTWTLFGPWVNSTAPNYLHADGRVLRSWNGVMYLGTDGYLGRTTDNGATWSQVNNTGTGVREFYRIGTSPARTDMVVGGSQDNGTSILIDSTWYEWFGGDGMDCHLNWTIPEIWYGNWQYGGMRKTMDFGQSITTAKPNTSNGDWVTPTVLDRCNESSLFAGFDTLYKSTDHGDNWTIMEDFSFLGNIRHMTIAPSDSNYLYLARNSRIFASSDNGLNWTEVSTGLPNRSITRIAVHQSDPQHVAVTFSGFNANEKVFESTDAGSTWTNTGSGLPNLPVQTAVWQDTQLDRLWIGMDGGVWYKDNAVGWTMYTDSLPVQPIRDLEILHGANTIRAGIFGRGAWEAPLPGTVEAPRVVRIHIDPAVNTINRPNQQDSVHVAATITSPDPMGNVQLLWGLDGVNFPNSLPMASQGADSFRTQTAIPPQAFGTQVYFRIRAEDMDGDTARTEKIVYRVKEAVLCSGGGLVGTGDDWITHVFLNTIWNTTGQTTYSNFFDTQQTTLFKGPPYTLEVTLNAHFPCDSLFAWIDYNNNLSFEPNEQLVFGPPSAFNTSTVTFNVPANAVEDTVVLRIRNIYDCNGPAPDPCNNYFGEVEDYGVIIETQMIAVEPEAPSLSLFPNPADNTLSVQGAGLGERVQVVDLKGVVLNVPFERGGEKIQLDVSSLPAGNYLLLLEQNGKTISEKFSVKH